jgi:leucine dehydrogenase
VLDGARLEHEELLVRRGPRSGLTCVVAVHSTVRGPSLGGCRLWSYAAVDDAVADALRLSRAMTFKSAAAGLPLGGGKGVIMTRAGEPPSPRRRRDALWDFAVTVDALDGRYVTAEDVGTSSRDMSAIAERTAHVAGLSRGRGGSGDPSPFTALGVLEAILATCARRFGEPVPTLRDRTVCVLGLGHVGSRIARLCADRGATLIVSDVDPDKRALAERLGARWMEPAPALIARVDVLVPCALGGVLDERSVARLRCRAIAGAANNQLADDTVAERLREREILWAPDFVANAGGIINIAQELGGYDPRAARAEVRRIGDTLREVFDRAQASGATPLAAALDLARSRLAAPGPVPSVRAAAAR